MTDNAVFDTPDSNVKMFAFITGLPEHFSDETKRNLLALFQTKVTAIKNVGHNFLTEVSPTTLEVSSICRISFPTFVFAEINPNDIGKFFEKIVNDYQVGKKVVLGFKQPRIGPDILVVRVRQSEENRTIEDAWLFQNSVFIDDTQYPKSPDTLGEISIFANAVRNHDVDLLALQLMENAVAISQVKEEGNEQPNQS